MWVGLDLPGGKEVDMGLDLVELVIGVEEAFGIAIPNSVAVTMTSPRKVSEYLESRLIGPPEGPRAGWTREQIDETLTELVKEHLGIERFSPDDEFVRDLGAG